MAKASAKLLSGSTTTSNNKHQNRKVLVLFCLLQNNAEQVRTSRNNTEQGASTTLKPRKIVCTFASIKKINVKPSEGKQTGRVLLEMKKRFFSHTLADTHKKLF